MNRRDFFKFGLGGAGLAVGGGLACSKEKIPQPQGGKTYTHPWWVKNLEKPKLAIDDKLYSRFHPRWN